MTRKEEALKIDKEGRIYRAYEQRERKKEREGEREVGSKI